MDRDYLILRQAQDEGVSTDQARLACGRWVGRANLPAMTSAFLRLNGARITVQASLRRLVSLIRVHGPVEEIECHVSYPSGRR